MCMKYISIITCLALTLLSNFSVADVDCPAAKISNIQVQKTVIYVYPEGQQWHMVGNIDGPGVKEMYSALLAAQISGKKVILRYPDGYDCSAYDLTIPANMVRTYND